MELLNVGLGELLLILLIALLVFGPEELPRVARRMGQAVRQMRDAASEMQTLIMQESEPVRRTFDETRQDVESVARPFREVRDDLTRNNPVRQLKNEVDEARVAVRRPWKRRSRDQQAGNPYDEEAVPTTENEPEPGPVSEASKPEVILRPPSIPPIARGEIIDEPDDA